MHLFSIWLVWIFCVSHSVHGYIERRAEPIVSLTVPLTLDAEKRYTAQVNMSSGPNPQQFRFALSTSIGYTTVAGVGCVDSCGGVPLYDTAASPSARQIEAPGLNISFLDGDTVGRAIKEDCTLHVADGSSWAYPNQTIIVTQISNSIFSDGTSGIIGIGGNSKDGNFSATQVAGWLDRNPTASNFSFGMQLDKPRQPSGSSGGELHWLSLRSSAYEGEVQWLNASTTSAGMDWNVPLTGWSSASGAFTPVRSGQNLLRASIDPYYPNIYVPLMDSNVIFSGIAGATPRPLNSFATVWNVPCWTNMTFTLIFGNTSFTLDQSDLVIRESDTSCVSAIQGWPSMNNSDFLLGSVFISSAYLIFQITRDEKGSIGFAKRALDNAVANDSVSKGLIAGVSVGGTLVVVGVAIAIFLFLRSRKKRRQKKSDIRDAKPAEEPKESVVSEPFDWHGHVRNIPSLSQISPATPSSPRRVLIEESPGSGIYVEAPSSINNPDRYSSARSASSRSDFDARNQQRDTYATYSPSDTPTTVGDNAWSRRINPPATSSLNEPISPTLLLSPSRSKYEEPPRYAM